jgi:NAD-dependent deacetylase
MAPEQYALTSLGIQSDAKVVILTGAGISAESGIGTFRDAGGLWEQHRIEDVATPQAFRRDPEFVWEFYRARKEQALGCVPNDGHRSIVALERRLKEGGGHLTLITQNVDHLHQEAGSAEVIAIHGSLFETICSNRRCSERRVRVLDKNIAKGEIPVCAKCDALLRPAVVWFGENLDADQMNAATSAVRRCDWFIAIGTSGAVYPVAGYVWDARNCGARTVLINLAEAENQRAFEQYIPGHAAQILPVLLT